MGKTQKPLVIGVTDPGLLAHPKLRELVEKGHRLELIRWSEETSTFPQYDPHPVFHPYDLVLGPRAWYMTPDHLKYLDAALKAARQVRYPKKEKE